MCYSEEGQLSVGYKSGGEDIVTIMNDCDDDDDFDPC